MKPAPATIPADPNKYREAISAWRKRQPMTEDEFAELDEAQREYAFTIAGAVQADAVAAVYEAVDKAIENGETLEEFQERVADVLDPWTGPSPARLETVFRTSINSAYNAGRHAVFSAPKVKEARPYFRFEVIEDDALDDECAACDGTILPQDDPWWSSHMPPLHPNCRCSFSAVTEEEAKAEGGVDDEGPDADVADGFGGRPSETGDDWEGPDASDYPAAVGDVLENVLDR